MYDWEKMKNIVILIPVYNDWESLKKLLEEINKNIQGFSNLNFDCLVINDCSVINQPKLIKPTNLRSLKIMNMKENRGHARCNAFGIRYITGNIDFDYVLLMDGDGEDRPIEIKDLVREILKNPKNSVVAKRIKRSEGLFFQFLYQSHKLITYLFTGKNINFGNYSCLTKDDAKKISSLGSLWSSYSGTVKKNLKKLNEIDSIRGSRYFGPSQMSLLKLLIHSFSIIAVFKYTVLMRSIFVLIAFFLTMEYIKILSFLAITIIIIFNILIFVVSLREKKKDLLDSQLNLRDIIDIKH